MTLKAGDRIVVISPVSSFYGMTGTIRVINPMLRGGVFTPFDCLCKIDGYRDHGDPIPFMARELRLENDELPSGETVESANAHD